MGIKPLAVGPAPALPNHFFCLDPRRGADTRPRSDPLRVLLALILTGGSFSFMVVSIRSNGTTTAGWSAVVKAPDHNFLLLCAPVVEDRWHIVFCGASG